MPTFLIIGAMKGGTWSLYEYLAQHPEVFAPDVKEPTFFVDCAPHGMRMPYRGRRTFLKRGEQAAFGTLGSYRQLFRGAEDYAARFEASTSYLSHPPAAKYIKELLPSIKLVALLRNPVDRAYSAYNFQRSFGREPAETFEEALREERAGQRDDWWYSWRHLHCGLYAQHLETYRRSFRDDQFLILRSESFFADPTSTCRRILHFIGVDPEYRLPTHRIRNETRIRNPLLTAAYRDVFLQSSLQGALRAFFPKAVRRPAAARMRRIVESMGRRPPPMGVTLRSELVDFFAADIERLGNLVDWDPRAWT